MVEKGGLMAECDFRVRKHYIYTCFFFKCWLVEPVRFGSVQFNRFQTLETETEPEFFLFFNRLIRFFFGSVFSGFFPIFSIYRFFCSPLDKTIEIGQGSH